MSKRQRRAVGYVNRQAVKQVGAGLRLWRERHDMTQRDLANLLGVTDRTCQRWEQGDSPLPAWILHRLMTSFDPASSDPFRWFTDFAENQTTDATEWREQDATNRFEAVVHAALASAPQPVMRRGHRVAIVLRSDEYDRLRRLDRANARTLPELLLDCPQGDWGFGSVRPPQRPIEL